MSLRLSLYLCVCVCVCVRVYLSLSLCPSVSIIMCSISASQCHGLSHNSSTESGASESFERSALTSSTDQLLASIDDDADGNGDGDGNDSAPARYLLIGGKRRHLPRDSLIFGFARPPSEGGALSSSEGFRAHVQKCIETVEGKNAKLYKQDICEFIERCHFFWCGRAARRW